jgi:serine/threonine protein kinase/predicted transcriptional regulator
MAKRIKVGEPANDNEELVFTYLKEKLPDDYTLITNLKLTQSGRDNDYDAILLAPHIIYVIEIKRIWGKIRGNTQKWILQNSKEIESPIHQVEQCANILKTLLSTYNLAWKDIYIQACVCTSGETRADFSEVQDNVHKLGRVHWYKEIIPYLTGERNLDVPLAHISNHLPKIEKSILSGLDTPRQLKNFRVIGGKWETSQYRALAATDKYENQLILKVYNIPGDLNEDDIIRFRERFERDKAALQKMRNTMDASSGGKENILSAVYDPFPWKYESVKQLFVVPMDWVDGQLLVDIVESGKDLTQSQKYQIASQICRGMALSHSAGVIHRNIHPGNIIWDKNGLVKIINFDFAKFVERIHAGSVHLENVAYFSVKSELEKLERYSAPELLKSVLDENPTRSVGELLYHEANNETDIYAIGVVLQEVFRGKLFEPGMTVNAESISEIEGLDSKAIAIITSFCAQEPADRKNYPLKQAAEIFRRLAYGAGPRDHSLPELEPGQVFINQYVIEGLIKVTDMSKTYVARTQFGDEKVVVKFLKANSPQKAREQAEKTFEILQKMDMEYSARWITGGFISIHDGKIVSDIEPESHEVIYEVHEFIDGENLRVFLTRGLPDIPIAIELAKGVMKAIAAVHRIERTHRDVKPENIMVCYEKNGDTRIPRNSNIKVKIIDFGLSRSLDEPSKLEGFSPGYTPSEVLPRNDYTPGEGWTLAGDVYSTACVIIAILCGEKTNDHKHPNMDWSVIDKKAGSEIKDFLIRNTSENPLDRNSSVIDMLQEFEYLLAKRKCQQLLQEAEGEKNLSARLNIYYQPTFEIAASLAALYPEYSPAIKLKEEAEFRVMSTKEQLGSDKKEDKVNDEEETLAGSSTAPLRAQQALQELDTALKAPALSNYSYALFNELVLSLWNEASNQVENLLDSHISKDEVENCQSRFKALRRSLIEVMLKVVYKVVDKVVDTGEAETANQWIGALSIIGKDLANEANLRLVNAQGRFQTLQEAEKVYQESVEKLSDSEQNYGSYDDARLAGDIVLRKLDNYRSTLITRYSIGTPDEDPQAQKILDWIGKFNDVMKPIWLRESVGSSIRISKDFAKQRAALQQADEFGLINIEYFNNPLNWEDLHAEKMTPKVALEICDSRWRHFSEDKIAEYIDRIVAEKVFQPGGPYQKDPQLILDDFLGLVKRVLRPVEELKSDTQKSYKEFVNAIEAANREARQVEQEMVNAMKPEDDLLKLTGLNNIKEKFDKVTPFLSEVYSTRRNNLISQIDVGLENTYAGLKQKFATNIRQTRLEALRTVERLKDYPEFEEAMKKIETLATFCQERLDDISKINNLPLQEALDKIIKLEAMIQSQGMKIPKGIDDLHLHIETILQPAKKSIQLKDEINTFISETKSKINAETQNLSDLEKTIEMLARSNEILRLFNLEEQSTTAEASEIAGAFERYNFIGSEAILNGLRAARAKLVMIEAYLIAVLELKESSGIDLLKVKNSLRILSDTGAVRLQELIPSKKIEDLHSKVDEFSGNDATVEKVLSKIETLLVAGELDLEKLLNEWKHMEDIEKLPTTLVNRRNRVKSGLQNNLNLAVSSYLDNLIRNPRNCSLKLAERAKEWAEQNPGRIKIDSIKAALYSARAWDSIKSYGIKDGKPADGEQRRINFINGLKAAYGHWLHAREAGQSDADANRLAVLKILAAVNVQEGNYRFLNNALDDANLKKDLDLQTLKASLELARLNEIYQDINKIKKASGFSEFDLVILQISQVTGLEKSEVSEVDSSFETGMASVWISEGYGEIFQEAEISPFPKPLEVREDAQYCQNVYTSLNGVFKEVDSSSTLLKLDGGKKYAKSQISQQSWGKNMKSKMLEINPKRAQLFKEKWEEYCQIIIDQLSISQ